MEDRNGGGIMAIGGVITVVIVGIWAMKFVQALFLQLSKTADAFAAMVTSVVGSLWALAQVAMLGSLIAGSVVAAVYFTYKYILMVKRGTELQQAVASQISELHGKVTEQFQDFRGDIENQVNRMRTELSEALKEPDPVPGAGGTNATKCGNTSAKPGKRIRPIEFRRY